MTGWGTVTLSGPLTCDSWPDRIGWVNSWWVNVQVSPSQHRYNRVHFYHWSRTEPAHRRLKNALSTRDASSVVYLHAARSSQRYLSAVVFLLKVLVGAITVSIDTLYPSFIFTNCIPHYCFKYQSYTISLGKKHYAMKVLGRTTDFCQATSIVSNLITASYGSHF